MSDSSLIVVSKLNKSVVDATGQLQILCDIDFSLNTRETVAIVGASGSGKSTLLAIIAGLDKPTSGTVHILNADLFSLKEDDRAALRAKHLAFVFQSFQLLGSLTALENVMLQDMINGVNPKIARERSEYILNLLKLEDRLHHLPSELSGGEQQRVAIARALAKSPSIILADEPTGNLDPYNADLVLEIFLSAVKELKLAALVVTHNEQLARRTDKIVTLKEGKITHL